jgi:hypothetical protein
LPPPRNSLIYGSLEDEKPDYIGVGDIFWYRCYQGVFDLYRDGSVYVGYIEITCDNNPDGISRASFEPYYHHEYSQFPPCVVLRKYLMKLQVNLSMIEQTNNVSKSQVR